MQQVSSMTMTLYPNQLETAAAIIAAIKEGCPWVILQAPMQSGKTSTFMFAAAELLRETLIDQFVVISGNSDIDLKRQTENPEEFWRSYQKYLIANGIGGTGPDGENRRMDIVDRVKSQFRVIWGTELKKYQTQHENALFVWDESHYAQSKGQLPERFLRLQKISPNGATSHNGNKVLSVSATPFSETIDVVKHGQNKRVIKMTVCDHYYGVDRMMEDETIKLFHEESIEERILEIANAGNRADGRNVGLIRTVNAKTEGALKTLCGKHGVTCVEMNSTTDIKDIDQIINQNNNPLIVLIKGMLRMGKRIAGKHRILWCIETANNANHDTILQGLLGRCCGYATNGSSSEITIYLPQQPWMNLKEWGGLVAGKAMNVKQVGKKIKNPETSGYATVPLILELPLGPEVNSKEELICALRDHINTTASTNDDTKDDLLAVLRARSLANSNVSSPGAKVDFRNLGAPVYQNACDGEVLKGRLLRHARHGTPFKVPKGSCGCILGQVIVWHNGLPKVGDKTWTTILQYKTTVKPASAINIGDTTGNEIFNMTHENGAKDQQNGTASFKLQPETAHDVDKMKSALESIIVWSREFNIGNEDASVVAPSEITSEYSGNLNEFNGIIVSDEVCTALKPGGTIYEKIKETQDVVLELKHGRGRVPKKLPDNYKRLAVISWI
jgi:hypothetical protein